MRALTALNRVTPAATGAVVDASSGKLPMMALDRIHPDPRNQILRDKDALTPEAIQEQTELNADVKKVGIKSPLSLRPYPGKPGHFIVNHGHRRRLAAIAAGLVEVPYFIDEKFTSYDQVKENLLRRGLTPWAFAEFIKAREEEGESRTDIADGLGKGKNFVTEHAVLIDAPACLHIAYERGVRSARTLYDLSLAYQEFPEQVDDWCVNVTKITRDTVKELVEALRNGTAAGQAHDQMPATQEVRHDEHKEAGQEPVATAQDHSPAALGVRHDEQNEAGQETVQGQSVPAPKVRHDEQTPGAPIAAKASPRAGSATATGGAIAVQYKGKAVTIAPGATIKILMDGQDVPVEVPVSELVFKGTK